MRWLLFLAAVLPLAGAEYAAPAGIRPAIRRPGAAGILPGGRVIASLGHQYVTGPGPFGLAISDSGKTVVTANSGPGVYSITVLESGKRLPWTVRQLVPGADGDRDWNGVSLGAAFVDEHSAYVAEGNSGRVRLVDLSDGRREHIYDLNQGGFADSYTGDLAYDAQRRLLYVLDQANFRLAIVDTARKRIAASVRLGRLPYALTLSPDRRKVYVTNIGLFEYRLLPGADPARPIETGLSFPPFGFPSAEALGGSRRQIAGGGIDVPGLGDPNAPEANSVCVVNVADPAAPKVEAWIHSGPALGEDCRGGSSPAAVLAAGDRVYVANAHSDSVTVIDARTNRVAGEIPIRISGLQNLRGVLPVGLAYYAPGGWLLVAEAGINAVGVIDTGDMRVLGHIPVSWFPTRVAVRDKSVFVTNARGQGTGPNVERNAVTGDPTPGNALAFGSLSVFPLPAAAELAKHTAVVMDANGFRPHPESPGALPDHIRHVVLIVKGGRSYDEVFGDIARASSGPAVGLAELARFGLRGLAMGGGDRLSVKDVNITPNHHAMAARWAFSDNFYADSETAVDGHHWLVGSYPDAWTVSSLAAAYAAGKDCRLTTRAPGRLAFPQQHASLLPEEMLEAGAIWHHLEAHQVSFRNYGEGLELAGAVEGAGEKPTGARFLTNMPVPDALYRNTSREYPQSNMHIPDQYRASQFIREIEEKYVKGGEELPRFLFLNLPNDHVSDVRPDDGYPFEASYVADNDYALGRIVEYLSGTTWWREMAIFITEDTARGGHDHIDAHRTLLVGVGPYFKKNYVSHVNSSFPGLLKTIFRLLGVPPLNLFDAAASDLSDCFTTEGDFAPYKALPEDPRIFVPEKARDAGER